MKTLVIVVALLSLLAACSEKLPLSRSQKNAISKEAADYLEKRKAKRYPNFINISAAQIEKAAEDFEKSESLAEDEIIRKYNLSIEKTSIGGISVFIITPPVIAPQYEKYIGFNIHGGGFIMGTGRDRTALLMAGELGLKIYSVDYTVAPKASFPVPINESLEVYKDVEKEFGGQHIIAFSSSAGGQIMLEMLLKAKAENATLPTAQILFCPNTDLDFGGDSGDFNDGRDYLAKGTSTKVVKKFYLKEYNAQDPFVSPVFANYSNDFPSSMIVSGSRDLMFSGAVRINWKFKEAGIHSELLVADGMWHGFHWAYEMPESIATFKAVSSFLSQQLMITNKR